ncbi:hypothetical protein Q7P37_003181 [Cladosporium fusiforme]
MSEIYVLGLRYNDTATPLDGAANNPDSLLEVRVGYFGLCARRRGETQWFCSNTQSGIHSVLANSSADSLGLVNIGAHFKDDVLFSGLMLGAIALTLLAFAGTATFPNWQEDTDVRTGSEIDFKPFPSRVFSSGIRFSLFIAAILLLVSALWQHVAAASAVATIATISQGSLSVSIGAAAIAFVWLSFALVVLAASAIHFMIVAIESLDRLGGSSTVSSV